MNIFGRQEGWNPQLNSMCSGHTLWFKSMYSLDQAIGAPTDCTGYRAHRNKPRTTRRCMISREATFHSKALVIEEALQVAIANVRSDSAREDWVLCGFQGAGDIRLIGTGVGGVGVSLSHGRHRLSSIVSRSRRSECARGFGRHFFKAANLLFEMDTISYIAFLGSFSSGHPFGLCSLLLSGWPARGAP